MKNAHLRLVANNAQNAVVESEATEHAFDAKALLARLGAALTVLAAIGAAPFRLVAFLGRLFVSTGLGFFATVYRLFLGMVGVALIGTVVYGLVRILFYPAFH